MLTVFLTSIQSKHFSISEYEPLHNLTHPITSKRLWLTSDRRISGLATRSWASSIDCRKEVLDTGYGDLRMKDSVRIRESRATLGRVYAEVMCAASVDP